MHNNIGSFALLIYLLENMLAMAGRKILVIVVFAMLWALPCRAQQSQEQLAQHYYSNGDFAQAAELYEGMYKRAPNKFYYQMLFRSYKQLERYKEAEQLAERRLKQYAKELDLYVDMGSVMELRGDAKKAMKRYDAAVDAVGFDMKQIGDLAQAFESVGRQDYAIKVYLTARKVMHNEYLFVSELATLYQRSGQYEAMMQEYFDLLDKQPKMLNQVQISLQRVLKETTNAAVVDGLRSALVQRVQKQPDNNTYLEMMIWFSLQQKDFQFAMVQAKAVDARFPNQEGEVLMRVAKIAQSNGAYDVARECYEAVAKRGKDGAYYFDSKVGEMDVKFAAVNRNFPIENKKLWRLIKEYEAAFDELGKNVQTIPLMRNYADLMAYYADSLQQAVDMLYDILDLPKISPLQRDEAKLALGDLLLLAGEVWDASLLYMQVEKANKSEVIGSKAKFKNAKLSYYNHDFLWAKTQLDVLRSSTSKLIANDAMELSLLISDNMEEDSTFDMLEHYAEAELLLYRNMLDSAWMAFDAIATGALSHPLFDEVLLQKAKIRIRQERYEEADSLLAQLVSLYPDDILADDGLMLRAQLNEEQLNNVERARECYEKLILDYTTSLYVDEARKRYNVLK